MKQYADVILLCEGDPELLSNPQKVYFEKSIVNLPYLQLSHSITAENLADIIQNVDLQEWIEIFIILYTFAKDGEFVGLAEQLSQQLRITGSLRRDIEGDESRKNAILTILPLESLKKLSTFGLRISKEKYPLL